MFNNTIYPVFKDLYNDFTITENKNSLNLTFNNEQYENLTPVDEEEEDNSAFSIKQTNVEWRINAKSLLSQLPQQTLDIVKIYAVALGALALLKSNDIMAYQKSGVDQSTIEKIIQLQHKHKTTIEKAEKGTWTGLEISNTPAFIRTDDDEELLVLGEIGKGGYKRVFKAADLTDNCLKAVARGNGGILGISEEYNIMQIFKEKKIPFIVTPYSYSKIKNTGTKINLKFEIFTMEYCSGDTLRDLLDKGPISKQTLIKWLIQIAEALQGIHEAGYVHKDIKTTNILVTEGLDGLEVRVADFGLSCSWLVPPVHNGLPYGTKNYKAPEAEINPPDPNLDTFAFGILAYRLRYGQSYYPPQISSYYGKKSEEAKEYQLKMEEYKVKLEKCKLRIREEKKANDKMRISLENTSDEAKKEVTLPLDYSELIDSESETKEKVFEKEDNIREKTVEVKKILRFKRNELSKSIFPNQDELDEIILELTQPSTKHRKNLTWALDKLRQMLE